MKRSKPDITQLAAVGRQAVKARDWARVSACALEISKHAPRDAEGPFLFGLAQKAARRAESAARYFARAIELDEGRYDAAIELAQQYIQLNRYAEARQLLDRYRSSLDDSPVYLDMAGQAYALMSLYGDAYPLYKAAIAKQPNVEPFRANLASCAVYLGKIDEARAIYEKLLKRNPMHQQNHYELSQLGRATDDTHIRKMLYVLQKSDPEPAKNIFIYYALGKEYEDLERWDDSFKYYKKGGDAVKTVADYDVATDVDVIDRIIDVCDAGWLADTPSTVGRSRTPVFIVGLPRTGTTLTDRILSSHSQVQSAGETQLLQMVLKRNSGIQGVPGMTPEIITAAAAADAAKIGRDYIDAISYRLSDEPLFIDKLPENVNYAGFIAKAWPDAKIVHLRRHPMDACFAMYKQSYFRFAYSLDDLAEYYLAYDRLSRHWRGTLGERMVEIEYEALVSNQEDETRRLVAALGLEFEEACLHFEKNVAAVATASSAQVREKAHTRSINKWQRYARHLEPLRQRLVAGGVDI